MGLGTAGGDQQAVLAKEDNVGTGFFGDAEKPFKGVGVIDEWLIPNDRSIGQGGDGGFEVENFGRWHSENSTSKGLEK